MPNKLNSSSRLMLLALLVVVSERLPAVGEGFRYAGDTLRVSHLQVTRTGIHQDQPSAARWYTRGFYNTDERMGVGMRWTETTRAYEFTWSRVPLRRFSFGIFAEVDVDDTLPEKLGAVGGGVEAALFPLLPGRRSPFGLFVRGRGGGVQCVDQAWGRQGGSVRWEGEAGLFAQVGRKVMLIPRTAVRTTTSWAMRHGKRIGELNETGVHLGAEVRVFTFIPGFFIYTSDGNWQYEITFRFAYR